VNLLVGAPGFDGVQSDAGAVHGFQRSGASWNYVNRVDNPHPSIQHDFGRSLDLELLFALVGALPIGDFDGWVVVLDLPAGTWAWHSNFRPLDATPVDDLGASVAFSSSAALVGSPNHPHSSLARAASYSFDYVAGQWIEREEIIKLPGDMSMVSSGISGDLAVMVFATGFVASPGSAYAYRIAPNGVWAEIGVLPPNDNFAFEGYGTSIAASGDCALVGSPDDFENGAEAGAAWIFCDIPQLALIVALDILCCEKIPDYTTAPVEFEIRWENTTAQPISSQRSVRLLRYDQSSRDLVASEQVDLAGGASLVEPFSIDLTPYVSEGEGAAFGDYLLILEWTDAEGSTLKELEPFSIVEAAAVPLLPLGGIVILGLGLVGLVAHRTR
jgi:hypothetical protein